MTGPSYEQVLTAQRKFFRTNATRSIDWRKEQLRKLKKLIVDNREAITTAVFKDLKRNAGITGYLEIGPSLTEIDYFIENLESWTDHEHVDKTLTQLIDTPKVVSEPYGTVLVITTWNFPALMYFYPLIPVLGAGNTCIFKGSELSEVTTALMAKLINETFDPEVAYVFTGGPQVTTDLLKLRFDKIMYTGNPAVGRIIMEAAAKHLTPCVLELGGKCPAVVCNDADIDLTAKRLIWAKFTNAGQVCITVDYVIATHGTFEKLIESMRKWLVEFYGTDAKYSKDYSRIINLRHFDRLNTLLEKTAGKVQAQIGRPDRSDLFLPPTVVEVEPFDVLMSDEIFGPILPVMRARTMDDAIHFIQNGPPPLASYVFSKNKNKLNKFIEEVQCGSMVCNDLLMQYSVDTLPFGGVGNSGMGVYRGKHGFDEFSHKKAVLVRGFFGEKLLDARYPPYDESKFKTLAMLSKRRAFPPAFFKYLRPSFFGILLGVILCLIAQKLLEKFGIIRPTWDPAQAS